MPKLFWGYIPRGKKNFETFYAEPEKAILGACCTSPSGCNFGFLAATALDFAKSPRRSTLATPAGFLLILLVSPKNPKFRYRQDSCNRLLDVFYFTSGSMNHAYLEEMRFQNTEILNPEKLREYTRCFDRPRITQAAKFFLKIAEKEKGMKDL